MKHLLIFILLFVPKTGFSDEEDTEAEINKRLETVEELDVLRGSPELSDSLDVINISDSHEVTEV